MTDLHDAHSCAVPVEHLALGHAKDRLWHASWSRAEIKDLLVVLLKLLITELLLQSLYRLDNDWREIMRLLYD